MIKCKLVSFFYWLVLSILYPVAAFSVTPVHSSGGSAVPRTSQTKAITVKKAAVLIKQIKNNVLYTINDEKYDLTYVKIRDFRGMKKVGAYEGRVAELTFVNNVLKEIVIRH